MTRTAYDLREKRIICRPFGIDKRKSDLKCISEIHHIVKTAEFDMGVEESYEYGKCNKDNQNTGNCRVAETKNRNPESSSTGGYLYGIGTPTARIVCVGLAKNNRGYEQVVDSQSVPWGTTGVSTPSWWTPVMCGSYSDQYRGLVQYSFNLIYSDGTVSCAFTHGLAK